MSSLEDVKYCALCLAKERFGKVEAERLLAGAGNDAEALFDLFRNLANVREPAPVSEEFLAVQDRMLRERIAAAGIADAGALPPVPLDPRISLWRGDITTLKVDAIVNAANSQMLGCWVPGHRCIDNTIHTYAGVQLRAECDRVMHAQGHAEPTGSAKVTHAYNLPATWVVHTVGPIVNGPLAGEHRLQLASCYTSCLEAAARAGAQSIAFCCVSTGLFGFPSDEAARVAVQAVHRWLENNQSDMHVVFNVFEEKDEVIYRGILFG